MAGVAGSERYLESILPAFKYRGVDISFLIIQHPKNIKKNQSFINKLRDEGVAVHVFQSHFSVSPWIIWKIAKLIRSNNFDILYSNLIYSDFIAAAVKKIFIPRLILLSIKHGYDEGFQTRFGLNPEKLKISLFSVITKWSALQADKVICISKSLEKFFDIGGLINPQKLITIPYGFNFSSINLDLATQDFRYGEPQIILTGRLEAVKQHHLLIEILPELLQDFPKLAVVMVGDGALASSLKILGQKLGVDHSIRWLGFQDNVHNFIQASDIMVIPSSAEGFGLVVLETWFHAKPVVAFDVPAINEIIEHGKDGLLIEPFSQPALLKAIRTLLHDSKMLSRFGLAGQIKQNTIYDLDNMAVNTLSVLRDLHSRLSLDNNA